MTQEFFTQIKSMARKHQEDVSIAITALNTYRNAEQSNENYSAILEDAVQLCLSSQRLFHAAIANAPGALGTLELELLANHAKASQTLYRATKEGWTRVGESWKTSSGTIVDYFGDEINA